MTAVHGYDIAIIGRYTVIVWTGSPAVDLDDGYQVMEVYIPTTDRACPDGKMIVGRRRLDTRDRSEARDAAVKIALGAISDYEAWAR